MAYPSGYATYPNFVDQNGILTVRCAGLNGYGITEFREVDLKI